MNRTILNPNVNASLLHEIRMIISTIFVSRSFGMPVKKTSSALRCVPCMRSGRLKPNLAIAIVDGNSICEEHAKS